MTAVGALLDATFGTDASAPDALMLARTRGSIDAKLSLNAPLSEFSQSLLGHVSASGSLTDLSVEGMVHGIDFDRGKLQFEVDRGKYLLSGDGQILDSAATVTIAGDAASGTTQAEVWFTLDEGARSRHAAVLAVPIIKGPLQIRFGTEFQKTRAIRTAVNADLTSATIAAPIDSFAKPPEKQAI